MHRGEIWWANLPEPRKSEPGYRRPVLIVQIDEFNRSNIHTVMVVAITSNLDLARAPGNVFLPAKSTGLAKDSVSNVSQMLALDKVFLKKRHGVMPAPLLKTIEAGLRLVLGL